MKNILAVMCMIWALPGLWGDFSLASIATTSSAIDKAGGSSETVQDGE
jgi:hypothetical protein